MSFIAGMKIAQKTIMDKHTSKKSKLFVYFSRSKSLSFVTMSGAESNDLRTWTFPFTVQ